VRVFSYDESGYRLAGLRRSESPELPSALLDTAWQESTVWIASAEAPPIAIGPAERERFARREAWPFRRTLALRPSSGGRRTVFRIPVSPQAGDVLLTAVGSNPEMWFALPSFETRFEIAMVVRGESPEERQEIFSRSLNPHHDLDARGWFDVEVPLAPWAGRDVWLELSVSVDEEAGESLLVGGFAEPRIVSLGDPRGPVAD
jgi:hypothetical protein